MVYFFSIKRLQNVNQTHHTILNPTGVFPSHLRY